MPPARALGARGLSCQDIFVDFQTFAHFDFAVFLSYFGIHASSAQVVLTFWGEDAWNPTSLGAASGVHGEPRWPVRGSGKETHLPALRVNIEAEPSLQMLPQHSSLDPTLC